MLIPLTLPWHESNGAVAGDGALVQVRSSGTLVIFITSSGEIFLLIIHCQFCFFSTFQYIKKKKKKSVAGQFLCGPILTAGLFSSGLNGEKMEHPYGKQYGQEGNPRAYMTMRDYRNLPYQWGNQQPVGRNPNPNMSLREYRDKWMSAPVYHVPLTYPPPPQYDYPEPPFYASPPQSPQPPQSIHPLVEQAILDLTRKVNDYVEENKKVRARSIVTVEDNLNKKLDGLKDDFEHKRDNLQDSIGDLIEHQKPPPLSLVEQAILNLSKQVDNFIEDNRVVNVQTIREIETVKSSLNKRTDGLQSEIDQKLDIQQESILKLVPQFVHQEEKNLEEESQEEESLTETVLVEQAQLQPQEELEVESLEIPEDLQDAPVNFWPWKNEEQNTALLTEKSSGHEGTQEPIIQPNPIDLDTTATAQDTKTPLPVAPSDDQVYILPTPATKSKPAAPAPKGKSNPLSAMQKFKELVAIAQIFATTSNKMANAYIAWHSGWFGCRFGFGAPGPRHF